MTSAPRRALITGLTGQDGSFLAELLLDRGYRVAGTTRPDEDGGLGAAAHLRDRVEPVAADLADPATLTAAVRELRPDELYHLAAPSFVPESWRAPALTVNQIAGATATLLEAIRDHSPATRAFFAGSSQMYGDTTESPQREETPCFPSSPYATAKYAAHRLVGQLRERDGLYACSGILFNHESERRPEMFVTRKVTRGAAAIKLGLADELALGDLDAVRDWSFAGDVMRGAWLMLQQDRPDDYVLASGISHTVRELAEVAFSLLGMEAERHLRVDRGLVRGPERTPAVGDPSRARAELGWEATLSFRQLVQRMVQADLRQLAGSSPCADGPQSAAPKPSR